MHLHSSSRICFLLSLALLASLPANAEADAAKLHAEEVEAWRQERLDELRQPDSYLTLVGLAWLEEGKNTCGSDPESTVVLPESAPARVGVFHVRDGQVELVAESGAGVTHEGLPVRRLALRHDMDGEPTTLDLGTIRFFLIQRGERLGVRIKDSASPTYTGFRGLDYFPVSLDWRKEARFEAYDPPRPVENTTILGTTSTSLSPGAVVFEVAGQTYRLEAFEGDEENELFLVFGDTTNREQTYGGGRFLYANFDGDRAVVDFNKAYNPPCVFSPYATCPLPRPENRLPIAVMAGEKTYAGGEDH